MATNDRLLVQILLLGLLAASLWVLAPFWSALFWAAVLAFASWPLMRLLTQLLNGRLSLAAGILTVVWVIMVAVQSSVPAGVTSPLTRPVGFVGLSPGGRPTPLKYASYASCQPWMKSVDRR